ncbi:MAG TPA: hypothetical protein VIJ79_05530 [Acidobacteriaceae bacterium]
MNDHSGPDETQSKGDRGKPNWVAKSISKIQSYRQKRRAEKEHESSTDRASRSTARATKVIAWLTLVNVGAVISQGLIFNRQLTEMRAARIDNDQAMGRQFTDVEKQTRAWVSPVGAELVTPIESGFPIRAQIVFENPGGEPAFDLNYAETPEITPIARGQFQDWNSISFSRNEKCDKLEPREGGEVLYPKVITPTRLQVVQTDTAANRFIFSVALLGSGTFFINGCVAYKTLGETHKSAFCFFLPPIPGKPSKEWAFSACPTGNHAD